ncbi:MAG: mucoidy inhibitor MuiA family protein [Hyphomicrobiaceae bacterium]|nr:mucoidy inhibitor MuiA family protein [Hyphomicrobiaceae bacterium]
MRLPLAVAALVLFSSAASAAEIRTHSSLDAVTVFPRGAEVTRLAKIKLEKGEHTLILPDLPAQTIPSSIRVEGKATGRMDIGSVDARRLYLPWDDQNLIARERRAIEQQIERLQDERSALESVVQTAEAQHELIKNLAGLPKQPAPSGGQGLAQTDWNKLFGLIGERMIEVKKTILDTRIKTREIDRKITDLRKRLVALAPKQQQRTEVRVFVAAAAPLEAQLVIRYQVPAASWLAAYDARLTAGAKNVPPSVQLVRRAGISQRTGEIWQNVKLTLSTTRPSAGTSAPVLSPQIVDFEPERPPPAPVASAPSPRREMRDASGERRRLKAQSGQALKPAMAPREEDIGQRQAGIVQAPFQALFAIPGRVTVAETGEVKQVTIDQHKMEPTLVVRTTPRVRAAAYLYARLTMPKGLSLLPGRVALFRDGTFVGGGQLPLLGPGEKHELGFGVDDSVRVRHAVLEQKRSETGLISASKVDQSDFRTTIKNLHERPITVLVIDQMPIAAHQDIKVDLTAKTAPTKRDFEDKRGVLAWEFKVEPDEEKQVLFGYRVSWPAAKRVEYRRR